MSLPRPRDTDSPKLWAAYYVSLGWGLAHLVPGTKGPKDAAWNTPAQWINTTERVATQWAATPTHGMGVIHAASNTVAVDVDDVDRTRLVFAHFGLDLERLLSNAPRIRGKKTGRDKVIFRAPAGEPLPMHTMKWVHPDDKRQNITLFELRSGPVHDVLPPSQHPDGHRYEWRVAPWELDEIPTLPAELLDFWRELPDNKDAIAALSPWADRPGPAPLRILPSGPAEGHNDVIGAYNRAYSVHTLLTANGYVKKGARYLAPSSTSKIPGVNILPPSDTSPFERAYSHHGSDVLANGHAHDAFDLFCLFQHHGDEKAAISAASSLLNLPVYGSSHPAIDVSAILARRAAWSEPDDADIPAHLLNPPGVLGDIARYGVDSAVRPVPIFAVQAALALGSVVCARRYVTSNRNYASCYFLNVAKSGTGKEEAKTTIEAILNAAGAAKLLGPSKYMSGNSVFSALLAKPQHIAIIDEFGKYLEAASAARDNFKAEAMTMLMESFGRCHADMNTPQFSTMTMRPVQAAEMEPKTIQRPAITVLGMTTPSSFYGTLSSTRVLDGFLNRFITVEHTGPRQPGTEWRQVEVPGRAVQWVQQILAPRGDLDLAQRTGQLPEPMMVTLTPGAALRMKTFERAMLAYAEELDADGFGDMPIRANEIGLRLGLICALADTPDTPVVTEDAVDWAYQYVEFFLRQTVASLKTRMADSETQRVRNDILGAIRAAGAKGVTERELNRLHVFTRHRKMDRDQAIDSLQKAALVAWARVPASAAGGRPRQALVALDPHAEPLELAG